VASWAAPVLGHLACFPLVGWPQALPACLGEQPAHKPHAPVRALEPGHRQGHTHAPPQRCSALLAAAAS